MSQPKQFGDPKGTFITRKTVYGVIFNEEGKVLAVKVNNVYHLAGGGIDDGESAETSLHRELMEEAGCEADELLHIGEANQFYEKTKLGPMNKLATFYSGKLVNINNEVSNEADHQPEWLSVEEIQKSSMADFQKWAVAQAAK